MRALSQILKVVLYFGGLWVLFILQVGQSGFGEPKARVEGLEGILQLLPFLHGNLLLYLFGGFAAVLAVGGEIIHAGWAQ